MATFENRLRKDTTDQSQVPSNHSGSLEKLQKLRNDAKRFTAGYAQERCDDGIASSSGFSRNDKITPPDAEEVIKSRNGRILGQELSLGHTLPYFLHKGIGGGINDTEIDNRLKSLEMDKNALNQIVEKGSISHEETRKDLNIINIWLHGKGHSEQAARWSIMAIADRYNQLSVGDKKILTALGVTQLSDGASTS